MLYNKNNTRKINDKKVLHKVGKHWVTLSIAMLATMGIGFAATGQAHHISMPATGVVAHADATTVSNYNFSGYDAKNANQNVLTNGGTIDSQDTINAPQGTAIKDVYNANEDGATHGTPGTTTPNQGINNDAANHNDGVSVTLNDDEDQYYEPNPNYVIRLGKRVSNTVNFMNNNNLVSSINYTGADGATHNFSQSEIPNGYQLVDGSSFQFNNNGSTTQDINVKPRYQWHAAMSFNSLDGYNFGGQNNELVLDYTGAGHPGNINLDNNVLNNLSANNLTIDGASTLRDPFLNGNNPVRGNEKVTNQSELSKLLKGNTIGGTLNFQNTDNPRADDNPASATQDYEMRIQFVDANPGDSGVTPGMDNDYKVGSPEMVDFGQNNPVMAYYHNGGTYTINDAVNDGHVTLPDGYALAGKPANAPMGIYDHDALNYSIGKVNFTNPSDTTTVFVQHVQSTHTNTWHAAIQYVDEYGHKIGNVHTVNTGLLVDHDENGQPVNSPRLKIGEPKLSNYGATGLFNDGLTIPNGYVVDNAKANKSGDTQSTYKTAKNAPIYEDYNNPDVTDVQIDPAREANVTLKDAVTGQIIKPSTPITFASAESNITDEGPDTDTNDPITVQDANGNNNVLGLPDDYHLAGYNDDSTDDNDSNNGNNINGLKANDILPMTDSTDPYATNDSIVNPDFHKVPNDTVLVYNDNPQKASTDYATIQFENYDGSNTQDLGNAKVVTIDTSYIDGRNEPSSFEPGEDNGVDLGTLLSQHPDLIPSGYQLANVSAKSQKVNYQDSEEPGSDNSNNITHVYLVPKSSDTYQAALQFQCNGQNVGMPVMVDTGATDAQDFNQNLGDGAYDGHNADSVRLGSFLDAFNVQAPVGYHFDPSALSETSDEGAGADTQVKLGKLQGATFNNVTDISVVPNGPSTSDYVAYGPNNTPNNPSVTQSTDSINYLFNGNSVGTANVTGNRGDSAANAINSNVPSGYSLKNDGSQNVNFDGNSHDVNVVKNGGLTPQQRLANLNKLYTLYEGLVSSGLFNN